MGPPRTASVRLLAAVIAAAFASAAAAQCGVVAQGIVAGYPDNSYISTLSARPDGGMYVGGSFYYVGTTIPAMHVAAWRDGVWSVLGSGVGGFGASDGVLSSVVMPNGDLVVGGHFGVAGGVAANNVARWDGSSWHALGGGLTTPFDDAFISEMVVMPNGDLVAAGRFYGPVPWLARWNGTAWLPIGGGGWEGTDALAVAPNGDLFVAYNLGSGARVMRWDGVAWTQVGVGTAAWRVMALHVTTTGVLIAGGQQPSVAAWNGSTWTQMGGQFTSIGNGTVFTVRQLPNGDLVVGGDFTQPASHIARWNGSSWQPIGTGIQEVFTNAVVLALAPLANGQLALSGLFAMVHGVPTGNVAVLSSTCPASVTSYGSGCLGSGGLVTLVATQWPMSGGFARGLTTGLTTNSFAVGVFAFSQVSIPLSSGTPLGLPGCDLLVADHILIQFMVGAGAVASSVHVPNSSYLIGATFYHQVIPVELNAGGGIQALSSSNALAMTIGAF
jgi:hypothetical protein